MKKINEDEEGLPESATQLTAQSRAMSHAMASISRININDRMNWNPSAASKASSGKKGKGKTKASGSGTKFPDILADLAQKKKLN